MESSKKKIIIAALAIMLIGSGVYFTTGGNFLQGRLARDMNPTDKRPTPASPQKPETPAPTPKPAPAPTRTETRPAPAKTTPVEPKTPTPAEPDTTDPDAPDEPVAPAEPATETPDNPAPANPAPDEPVAPEQTPVDTPPAETAELPVIFDTANFTVSAVMNPQKGGGYSMVSKSTALRYSESVNAEKDSYRIAFYFPGYSGDDKPYEYTTIMSAVICKGDTCAPAHTETVNVYKEPFADGQTYSYFAVTRGELYNAVQLLGAAHEEKVDFKMQIQDPNGKILTSSGNFKQKIEDDAFKKAFDLEGFKLTKGTYIQATDGSFIQLDYKQTIGNTKGEIIYFYTGDQDSFKFFIEICDAGNPTICANYLETQSTAIASIGGSYQIMISDLKTFADGVGFTAGTKLLFKIAVQDNVEGAEKHYATGFYLYMLQ